MRFSRVKMRFLSVLLLIHSSFGSDVPCTCNCNCHFDITTLSRPQRPNPGATSCPDGFLRHEDNCYYFSRPDENHNWFGAANLCKQKGSELVTIDTREEDEFIRKYLSENYDSSYSFWMGLNSLENFHKWVWLETGREPTSYVNWIGTEPNRPDTEHCGILWFALSRNWADGICYWPHNPPLGYPIGYICKTRLF